MVEYCYHGYLHIILIICLLTGQCWMLTTDDFFDYSQALPLTKQSTHFEMSIPYPHWADITNTKIDVINCGTIRFSGLDGLNTLDLLVLSTSLPIITDSHQIYYEEIIPITNMRDEVRIAMKDASIRNHKNFHAQHILICTWIEVQFYTNKPSTFQIILASDKNRTIAIIHVAEMTILPFMQFYPEVDLRFAYDQGTNFLRSGYLEDETGVPTSTKGTNIAAVENTNSGKNGRWVLDLSEDPRGNLTVTSSDPEPLPTSVNKQDIKNSTNLGLTGKFVFDELSLDNSVLTSSGNNDEISVILSKKESDIRYNKLNTNIVNWVTDVYGKATNVTGSKVNILGFKAGSLIVEYSVQIPNIQQVCADKSKKECLLKVENEVKGVSTKEPVNMDDMSGQIDKDKITVNDFDECSSDDGTYCDRNAYCVNYPNELSYGCICKDTYKGDGFPGNCNKDKESFVSKNIALIGVSAGAAALIIIVVIGVICFVKKKEKLNWGFKKIELENTLPKDMLPDDAINNKKKARSTRKMMVHAPYGRDFDIYHRT